jgi:uncharacterized membrane protein
MENFHSDISDKEIAITEKVSGKTISHSILNLIIQDHPLFTVDKFLSIHELNTYREKYISEYLIKKAGKLSDMEKTVLASMNDKTTLTNKINGDDEQKLTTGQRIADKVASFGGSWKFISLFGLFLFVWISFNIIWLANKGFDPYPFILLNLILSCLAAIQAPVIMMSQKRLDEKDRERAKITYMINLKSELEIRMLHEKIDLLIRSNYKE